MAVAQQVQWATFISRHCRYGRYGWRAWVLQNSMGLGLKYIQRLGAINGFCIPNWIELKVQKGMLLVMVKWRILGVLQLFHGDILLVVPSCNIKLCWLGFPPNMWLNGGMWRQPRLPEGNSPTIIYCGDNNTGICYRILNSPTIYHELISSIGVPENELSTRKLG